MENTDTTRPTASSGATRATWIGPGQPVEQDTAYPVAGHPLPIARSATSRFSLAVLAGGLRAHIRAWPRCRCLDIGDLRKILELALGEQELTA